MEPVTRRVRAAVVLAAGGSSRMGRPKALLELGGRPVVAWHCERLAGFAERVIVVVGADAERIRAALPAGVAAVDNPSWATTMPADSLALALASSGPVEVLVTPVDVLPASEETLAALLAGVGPAVPVDPSGNPGHPVLLDAATASAILRQTPAGGLRSLLEGARRVPVADPLVSADFDDPVAFRRMESGWRRS
jgi:CTP:molybdopterin cytidylyltransferase MocA